MRIITIIACTVLLPSVALFVGCEAHSLEETRALHSHGNHGHEDSHHKGGEEHGKTEPEKKAPQAVISSPDTSRDKAAAAATETIKKGTPRSLGL